MLHKLLKRMVEVFDRNLAPAPPEMQLFMDLYKAFMKPSTKIILDI